MEKFIKVLIFLVIIWLFDYVGIYIIGFNFSEDFKKIADATWIFLQTTMLYFLIPTLLQTFFRKVINNILVFISIINSLIVTLLIIFSDKIGEIFSVGIIGPILYIFVIVWTLKDNNSKSNKDVKEIED